MSQSSIIASWHKCKIEIGPTGENDAMASELENIGVIKDKSTSMTHEDGETLTLTATGGVVVAEEVGEGTVSVTTRVIEPSFELENLLTGAAISQDESELTVTTNVVNGEFSMKLTPKNIGSVGVKARRCSVTFKPGSSEEEGHYADITFKFLACADGELYKKFRVSSNDWETVSSPTFNPKRWNGVQNTTQVEMSTTTQDAEIYYTTNGDTPTEGSTKYEEPITLSSSTMVKAVAIKNGVASSVTKQQYIKNNISPA